MAVPGGFVAPDMRGALQIDELLARCPVEATTRGMFFTDVVGALKKRGLSIPEKRYLGFQSYPQREFIEFAAKAAQQLFPHGNAKEALRDLGRLAYPTMRESMIGRVMFGVLGDDVGKVMRLAPRGYELVLSHGKASLVAAGPHFAHARLVDVYTFLDCYQVGVWEGAVLACGRQPTTHVRLESPSTGELYIEW